MSFYITYYVNNFDKVNLYGNLKRVDGLYNKYLTKSLETDSIKVTNTFENPAVLHLLYEYLKYCKSQYEYFFAEDRRTNGIKPIEQELQSLLEKQLDLNIIHDFNKAFRKQIYSEIMESVESENN